MNLLLLCHHSFILFAVALKCVTGHPRRPRGSQSGREKGRDESFQLYGRKSPWIPTLTELFPADAGSWLDTKNALYYCAQSANSFSSVLFVSSYTTAIVSITVCLAHAPKKYTQSGNFQFDIKSPSDFKILPPGKLKTLFEKYKLSLQQVFTLASVMSCVNIRNTTTADNQENVAWKREFTFFQFVSWLFQFAYFVKCKRTPLKLNFYQSYPRGLIQVYEENEFCHCLFTSFTTHEIRHFHG